MSLGPMSQCLFVSFQDPRSNSYRYATQPKEDGNGKKKKKNKKDRKSELEDLKQELEMVSPFKKKRK